MFTEVGQGKLTLDAASSPVQGYHFKIRYLSQQPFEAGGTNKHIENHAMYRVGCIIIVRYSHDWEERRELPLYRIYLPFLGDTYSDKYLERKATI